MSCTCVVRARSSLLDVLMVLVVMLLDMVVLVPMVLILLLLLILGQLQFRVLCLLIVLFQSSQHFDLVTVVVDVDIQGFV